MMRCYLFLLAFLISSWSVRAEKAQFRLVTENFPPYNYSKNNKPFEHSEAEITGICTEIVQEIFKRTGYSYSIKLRGWSHAYNYAQRKKDRGVFGTSLIEERKPLFKLVGPLIQNDWVIFSGPDFNKVIKSEEDLKNYKIGAYKNDVRAEYLKSKGLEVSELTSDHLNPKRLRDGLIDLWVSGGYSGPYYAKQVQVVGIKPVFTLKQVDLYLAMNRNTADEHIKKMNDAMQQIRSEGFVDQVINKYK